jgi:hypothetical protein
MTKSNRTSVMGLAVEEFLRNGIPDSDAENLQRLLLEETLSPRDRRNLVLVDQRLRWMRGNGRSVEDYLQELNTSAANWEISSDFVADLIYGEWLARGKSGVPEPSVLMIEIFPDLPQKLRLQMELLESICDEAAALSCSSDLLQAMRLADSLQPVNHGDRELQLLLIDEQIPVRKQRIGLSSYLPVFVAIAACLIMIAYLANDSTTYRKYSTATATGDFRADYDVAWTVDVYRSGDMNRHERLTDRPSSLYGGDAFRIGVGVKSGAHVYVYTVGSNGIAAYLGTQNKIGTDRFATFPPQDGEAITVPENDGTLLCVVIVRDSPFKAPETVLDQLRFSLPLPGIESDTLLVDGIPLMTPRLLPAANGNSGGVMLADLKARLGESYASRSIGPAEPIAATEVAVRLKEWYLKLPEELGDVHYLGLRVIGKP